jgi:hypothetical protein
MAMDLSWKETSKPNIPCPPFLRLHIYAQTCFGWVSNSVKYLGFMFYVHEHEFTVYLCAWHWTIL